MTFIVLSIAVLIIAFSERFSWVSPPRRRGQVNEADYEQYGYDSAGNRLEFNSAGLPGMLMRRDFKVSFAILASILLGCCQYPEESVARFCISSPYTRFINKVLRREYVDINLAHGRLYASDTSEIIDLVNTERYFGMTAPIPVLVPKLEGRAPADNVIRISHDQLRVIFRPASSRAGEFLGEVYRPLPGGGANRVLTYRYSRQDGVYEIVNDVENADHAYQQVFRKCGGATLFAQPID